MESDRRRSIKRIEDLEDAREKALGAGLTRQGQAVVDHDQTPLTNLIADNLKDHRRGRAVRYALIPMTAQSIRPAPTPPVRVQVPGPTGQRATEEDYDLRDLSNKLNSSHSAKDAARLLSARRAKSR